MPIAIILAAVALAASAIGATAQSIPSKKDNYRKFRLSQLEGLVNEGLTTDQEEQLRQMGMGSVQAQEREIRGRRADNLAALTGGATAQDMRAFEASDAERVANARQAVDAEIIKQDQQAKDRYRQEQSQLLTEQEQRRKEKTNAWLGVLGTASQAVGTVAAASDQARMEGTAGTQAVTESASRVYGAGSGKVPMPNFAYQSPAVKAWWNGLTPEQQQTYAAQYNQ